ncbi:MAG: SpoVR family protein [Bdellovibrionaceae bacterium]|nr:SpoVR family protein [Bdellovibrionales bacterium]MCB9086219.1 SpoVR family protein [Pseudobdellovibrionaceae bacterium]
MGNLTSELERERVKICRLAKEVGLDCFETIFEMVNYKEMNQIAAYGGFPVRYPHWRFGMEYEQLSKSYEYGLSKIYELVINNDPCYAYLMEGNEFVDQKLVMAHVYGHCDFFKNNQWFSPTNRKMMDAMANHGTRIRRYMDRYGVEVVEDFIDVCLSLENLIDRHSPYVMDASKPVEKDPDAPEIEKTSGFRLRVHRDYMEKFINPPEVIAEAKAKAAEREQFERRHFPPEPARDVLKFLMSYAPLESWQQDVMSIIREEAYYFAPQGMTKIMNEGWASYWHSKLMTEKIATAAEIVDFADRHSGTMAMSPSGFNPYKVGIELFRDIESRWDKGRYGKEWEECQDMSARKAWDTGEKRGRDKIFEVRRNYNDVTFIDEYLTEEFCVQNRMFVYKFNKRTGQFEVDTRDFKAIKAKFLFQLTNFGQPIINVIDANFENRGELLLAHMFEGVEMQPDYMQETMKNMYKVWQRPVNVATVLDNERRIVSFDGRDFKSILLSDLPVGEANEEEKKA